jgi:hypothetical protein
MQTHRSPSRSPHPPPLRRDAHLCLIPSAPSTDGSQMVERDPASSGLFGPNDAFNKLFNLTQGSKSLFPNLSGLRNSACLVPKLRLCDNFSPRTKNRGGVPTSASLPQSPSSGALRTLGASSNCPHFGPPASACQAPPGGSPQAQRATSQHPPGPGGIPPARMYPYPPPPGIYWTILMSSLICPGVNGAVRNLPLIASAMI